MDMQHDQAYGDDEDCDGQENYEENDPGAQVSFMYSLCTF